MARFEIDTNTGEWLSDKPLSVRESYTIAASVLPGVAEFQVMNWYESIFAEAYDHGGWEDH